MTTSNFFITVLLFILFYAESISQTASEMTLLTATAEQLLIDAVHEKECIGISAGISVDGQILWSDESGFADEKKQSPFQTTTISRTASISKPMTAIAIMQLYENNQIELDIPIQNYLPMFPKKKEGDVTTRQLLMHSAGIGTYKNGKERENKKHYESLKDAMKVFDDRPLNSVPGKQFNYATYGYVILGRIIEEISGMTYGDYMKKYIWDKAGMTHTSIENSKMNYTNKSLLFHKKENGKINTAKPTDLSDRIPGGGIQSTVEDLLKLGNAILDHTLISEGSLKMMAVDEGLKKEGNGYGLGWYLYGVNPKLGPVIGHSGGQTGCSSFFMLIPEKKAVVITLSNTSGSLREISDITVGLLTLISE